MSIPSTVHGLCHAFHLHPQSPPFTLDSSIQSHFESGPTLCMWFAYPCSNAINYIKGTAACNYMYNVSYWRCLVHVLRLESKNNILLSALLHSSEWGGGNLRSWVELLMKATSAAFIQLLCGGHRIEDSLHLLFVMLKFVAVNFWQCNHLKLAKWKRSHLWTTELPFQGSFHPAYTFCSAKMTHMGLNIGVNILVTS